jgi:hypothetical protein
VLTWAGQSALERKNRAASKRRKVKRIAGLNLLVGQTHSHSESSDVGQDDGQEIDSEHLVTSHAPRKTRSSVVLPAAPDSLLEAVQTCRLLFYSGHPLA